MPRPFTAEDLWSLKRVGQPEPVPGTSVCVVPVVHYTDEGKAHSTLYLVDRDGMTTRLTSATRSSSSPMPSPSGDRVAFIGSEGDDPGQVYVMRLDGGEAEKVSDFPLGTAAVQWVPGRNSLVAVVPVFRDHLSLDATAEEKERREGKTLPVATEDRFYRYWKRWIAGSTLHHLVRIDLDSGDATDITPGLDRLIGLEELGSRFTIDPTGTTIYALVDANEPAWEEQSYAIHSVPVDGGEIERLPTGEAVNHHRPKVSPDGETLLYGAQYEHAFYADRVRLISHHLPTGSETVLTPDWDRSAGGWEFVGNDGVVFHAQDEGHVRLYTMPLDGGTPTPQTSTGSNHGPRAGVGCYWHRSESMARPPEVAYTCGGHTTIASTFNDEALSEFKMRPAEEIRFEGADGHQIQAFVVVPPEFDSSERWPLLQNVHGGPHNGVMDDWHWRWNTQVMAAAGYVVMSVNFHGSSSFGDEFTRSIRGSWGDQPAKDIDAASDHMIGLGYIDPDRIAIAGGSYGGYLVSWITTQTDRYAASICHAGVTDLLGQWASDLTEGRAAAVGGVPWEDMDAVLRWSPMAHTHDITTPTLVIHGELDYRVVITQGLVLYGTLKAKGVPARLVYYGDEGHWIEKRDNAIHWWGEFLGWLDRWIGTSGDA